MEELSECGIEARYILGAKIMTIENISIRIVTGDMNQTLGSIFVAPNDGNVYVPYSAIIKTLAQLIGAEKKEPPFISPEPASLYNLTHYWGELKKLCSKATSFDGDDYEITQGE